MIYYWFNRQEILQKAKQKYSKEKGTQYYAHKKEAIKSREHYRNWQKKKKTRLKCTKEKYIKNWFGIKKKH